VTHDRVRRHDLTLIEEGLWHWPELYSLVVTGPPGSAGAVRETIDAVCRAAQDGGGAMEYCHGVGWKLAHLMDAEHGAAVVEAMRRVKRADPPGYSIRERLAAVKIVRVASYATTPSAAFVVRTFTVWSFGAGAWVCIGFRPPGMCWRTGSLQLPCWSHCLRVR
jgi:hypothetical protein